MFGTLAGKNILLSQAFNVRFFLMEMGDKVLFSGRDQERGQDWSSINQFLLNQEAKETLLRLVSFNDIVSSLRAKV